MKFNKQATKNILIFIAAIVAILSLGGVYLLATWWLINGFSAAFTIGQTARIIAILWLTVSTVKFINGIKIEK